MSAITSRAGKVYVRVGGNSQEKAAVALGGLPNDTAIEKVQIGNTTVRLDILYAILNANSLLKTFTPTLLLSPSLVYAMGNISQLLPVDWFVGMLFFSPTFISGLMPILQVSHSTIQKILGKLRCRRLCRWHTNVFIGT